MSEDEVDLSVHERLAGRSVIASISGGKDSAAMSLHLRELGIEHDRVFLDTGWESEITYNYIDEVLEPAIGPITRLKNARQMPSLIIKKAMFPSRTRRFCTQQLKVLPMQRYIAELDEEVVNAVGIRAGESLARARMSEWEWSEGFDCETWRPLINWTEQDVIDIHARHGLAPNPLYLMGANRVGCWPCIFARKAEIRFIADNDPGRIDLVRRLEAVAARRSRARAETRGEIYRGNDPTWFTAPTRDANGQRLQMPIDDVIAWSRTSRGGKQLELFQAPEGERGCMRWGLCETHGDEPDERAHVHDETSSIPHPSTNPKQKP